MITSSVGARFLSLFLSLGVFLCAAQAQTYLVDWSGNFLEKGNALKMDLGPEQPINGPDQKPIGVGFPYSDEVPKSPNTDYLKTKASSPIYGVLQFTNPLASTVPNFATKVRGQSVILGAKGENVLSLTNPTLGEGSEGSLKGLFFWKKTEFPAPFNEVANLTWQSIVSLSLNITRVSAIKLGREADVRFAILSGGQWYLSESHNIRPGIFSANEPNFGKWSAAPVPLPVPDAPKEFPVKCTDLADIAAIGIYFNAINNDPALHTTFSFKAFQVEGTVPTKK